MPLMCGLVSLFTFHPPFRYRPAAIDIVPREGSRHRMMTTRRIASSVQQPKNRQYGGALGGFRAMDASAMLQMPWSTFSWARVDFPEAPANSNSLPGRDVRGRRHEFQISGHCGHLSTTVHRANSE